jgi:hypothetical protein
MVNFVGSAPAPAAAAAPAAAPSSDPGQSNASF